VAAQLKALDGADGFDRLLVAQAMTEPLRFLTANPVLAQYSELVEVAA
jgi:PIN domain nuclease of toxin-antitoxin system